MSSTARVYDFIVLGATGFTGKHVATRLRKEFKGIKWAIAGRSEAKLADLMKELTAIESEEALPALVVVDIAQKEQLETLFGASSVVLNCTGPFRFLGDGVVLACIAAGAHYLDICGEPQFMESSFLNYHEAAKSKGVLILHACAFDSVPADLGAVFVSRQFPEACCSSIESFLTIIAPKGLGGHYTTYECAVHGFGDAKSLKRIRQEIDTVFEVPKPQLVGPKLNKDKGTYFYDSRVSKYAMPFMGADASVVRSTQRSLTLLTGFTSWPQYGAYVTIDGFYNVAATTMFGGVFSSLASFEWGRNVLLQYPETFTNGIFSHTGPTAEQLLNTSFEMHFYATGYSKLPEQSATQPLVVEDSLPATEPSPVAAVQSDIVVTAVESVGESPATEKEFGELDGDVAPSLPPISATAAASSSSSSSTTATVSTASAITSVLSTPVLNNTCLNWKSESSDGPAPAASPIDLKVHAVVSGPEPGYVATPIIFLALAQCMLEERDSMPVGGVFTPAAAFFNSKSIFDRLKQVGIEFKVVERVEVSPVAATAAETTV